jgi:hypothetical protein
VDLLCCTECSSSLVRSTTSNMRGVACDPRAAGVPEDGPGAVDFERACCDAGLPADEASARAALSAGSAAGCSAHEAECAAAAWPARAASQSPVTPAFSLPLQAPASMPLPCSQAAGLVQNARAGTDLGTNGARQYAVMWNGKPDKAGAARARAESRRCLHWGLGWGDPTASLCVDVISTSSQAVASTSKITEVTCQSGGALKARGTLDSVRKMMAI